MKSAFLPVASKIRNILYVRINFAGNIFLYFVFGKVVPESAVSHGMEYLKTRTKDPTKV